MTPSVLVTVPNGDGWLHKHVVFALLRLHSDARFRTRIIIPTHRPLENNQHHILREWLVESREDYWLSIDADNPPKVNPLEAIDHDKDIVGFPTPVWHYTGKPGERPFYWNAYRRVGDEGYTEWNGPKEGLQRVDAIGMGCFLMARRVVEHPAMQLGPFTRKLHADGTVDRGNDISFCERATAAGFEIWADFDRPCMHFVELELTEVARGFLT